MALKARVEKLEKQRGGSAVLAVAIAGGVIRSHLTADGVLHQGSGGLTEATLPEGCYVYRYDAAQEYPMLYRTQDGRAWVKVIEGVSEDEMFGPDSEDASEAHL